MTQPSLPALTADERAVMARYLSDTLPSDVLRGTGAMVCRLVKSGWLSQVDAQTGSLNGKQVRRQAAPTRAAWIAARAQRITRLATQRDVENVASWHEPGEGRWLTCWPNGGRF